MNIRKQIGQLMMVGLSGPEITLEEKKFLQQALPAGVIYFRRNVATPSQLAHLSFSLGKLLSVSSPPLIGIDQEGGRVKRLEAPFTLFPGNDFLGRYVKKTKTLSVVRDQARAMISELKTIGVNLNFVPVADIHSNPKNPVIGPRSFGTQPHFVASLVKATVETYRAQKMISCVKHFPGHGDTSTDSHYELPCVKASKTQLYRRELIPFRVAIRSQVPMVMAAHVFFPALDSQKFATLSPLILKDLLREKLQFKGVVATDDIEMKAFSRNGSVAEAAVEAIQAGVDLLLVCKSLDLAQEIYEKLILSIEKKKISSERIQASLKRIETLKKNYLRDSLIFSSIRSWPQWKKGWLQHQKLALKIAKA